MLIVDGEKLGSILVDPSATDTKRAKKAAATAGRVDDASTDAAVKEQEPVTPAPEPTADNTPAQEPVKEPEAEKPAEPAPEPTPEPQKAQGRPTNRRR